MFTIPRTWTELLSLYSCPYFIHAIKSIRMRWAGHVARVGERKGACRFLVGNPEGKVSLGRHRRRWEGNIKMSLIQMESGGVE
jgi:hypothetical protein